MRNFEKPKYRLATNPIIGELSGAGIVALQQAERYGTDLVIMENGKIVHISPEEARKRKNEKPCHSRESGNPD